MAYDTEGYGKVANPFWDLPEEGGGGGGDVPDPSGQANYQVIGTRNGTYRLFDPSTLVRTVPSGDPEDVGKVLTKYGEGSNQYGWLKAQAAYTDYSNTQSGLSADTVQGAIDELAQGSGGSETVLFDNIVNVDSSSTGAGWAEIPAADRVQLFENNLLKFSKIHIEVSFVTELREDVRTRTENFSCDFDLNRILVSDAQDYSDPEHSSEKDDNAQAYVNHAYIVNNHGTYTENIIEVNLNFNLFGTNPDPAVNTFSGKLVGLYFENRLVSSGSYQNLPSEQAIRVKVTAK